MNVVENELHSQQKEKWVYREYDFYPQIVENKGKVSKIVCDRGTFALKHVSVKVNQLHFLDKCFKYLNDRRFEHIIPFVPNKFGDPFVTIQGEGFYVTPWISDSIENKYKQQWEQKMIEMLARLHRASVHEYTVDHTSKSLSANLLEKRWLTRLHKMQEYKSFAEQREIMSPMEEVFLTHFDYLHQLGLKALNELHKWQDKMNRKRNDYFRTVLCHGHVHRQNVVQDDSRMYLINFDYANFDTPARDVALFYRRHLDQIMEWDADVGLQWLKDYEKVFPLHDDEKRLLSIYLLFPEHVFKEIDRYYRANSEWHPIKLSRYFERQVQLTYYIRRFVKKLKESMAAS